MFLRLLCYVALFSADLVFCSLSVAQVKTQIEIVLQTGHSQPISSIAISPDGKIALTAGADELIKLWDLTTASELRTLNGHLGYVTSVAISPDGKTALSGSGDKTIKLWDIATGNVIRTFKGHETWVHSVTFLPDGKKGLSGGEQNLLKLWDLEAGIEIRQYTGPPTKGVLGQVNSVVIGSNGLTALSASDALRLWDLSTGREIRTFGQHKKSGDDIWITSAVISPDGKKALSANSNKGFELWDLGKGRKIREFFGSRQWVESVAFSPDGKTVLSGGFDGLIELWDLKTGRQIWTFADHTESVTSVAFLPDGKTAVFASGRRPRLLDLHTGKEIRAFIDGTEYVGVNSVALSPDNQVAVAGGWDKTLTLWDLRTGRQIRKLTGHVGWVNSVAISFDGKMILSGSDDTKLKLWDLATGAEIRTFNGHSGSILSVAFSPDGKTVLSGSEDTTVKLWDLATGSEIRTLVGHSDWVRSVAFSPDGKTAISGSHDRTLKLWDLTTGREIRTFRGHWAAIWSVVFLPDGKSALSGSDDKTLKLWDLATGENIREFVGHTDWISSVAVLPQGRTAVSVGNDKMLRLWDLDTGQNVFALKGSSLSLMSVALSRDGRSAVTGSRDGTLRLWDLQHANEIVTSAAQDSDWIMMVPPAFGGFFEASSVENKFLAIVRGLEATRVDQIYQSLFNPDLVREALAGNPDHELEKATEGITLEKVLDSGKPPSVSFAPTLLGSSLNADEVKAKGEISDEGGGIGRIEWRVNGLTVGVEYPPQGVGKSYSVLRTLPLDKGKNDIELVAYNGKNLMASVAAKMKVTSTAAKKAEAGRLHVIVFGLNDYERTGLPNLHYAVPDALAIGKALTEAGKGLYASVTVTGVLDPGIVPPKNMDRVFEATSSGLEKAFEAVAQEAQVQDTFLFFAAGHGTAVQGRFHLLGQDYYREGDTDASIKSHGIGQEKLQAWIANIKAKRGLILLDSCESGAAVTGASRNDADAALGKLHEATGRPVITAANVSQAALEGYEGHGVFTSAILDALVNGDANNNGTIEVSEIADWVQAKVPELSEQLRAKGSRGIALGYASQGYAERMAIPAKNDQLANQELSGQKPRTGSRGENFSLVNKMLMPE